MTEIRSCQTPGIYAEAAQQIRNGELVVLPTETVYGIVGINGSDKVKEKIFTLKGRPENKPLQILIHSPTDIRVFDPKVPPAADALMRRYWPGPLTLVLECGRGRTLGFRCPDHAVTQAVLQKTGVPLAATSANIFGEPPATEAEEAVRIFNGKVTMIITGENPCRGNPSTVIYAGVHKQEILRKGEQWTEMKKLMESA